MTRSPLGFLAGILFLGAFGALTATAQSIGIGAGLAIPNDKIAQVTTQLAQQGLHGGAEAAQSGYYVELRGRFGKALALTGGIGYNHFAPANSGYFDESDRSVELQSSQTMIPVSAGVDMRLGQGIISPYLSLEATYNLYMRSFSPVQGESTPGVTLESSTDSRFGAAVGGGVNFDLSPIDIEVGARLHVANLLNQENGEAEIYYLQLGATLYVHL
ncbi:MAG: hypothetical protein JWQ98_1399 [Chlorobi bacterium]|nr:hypothetical protein [Chlorobiota bacterium]